MNCLCNSTNAEVFPSKEINQQLVNEGIFILPLWQFVVQSL